jgi:hypothetical protein
VLLIAPAVVKLNGIILILAERKDKRFIMAPRRRLRVTSIKNFETFSELDFNLSTESWRAARYIAERYKRALNDSSVFQSQNKIYDGSSRGYLFEIQRNGTSRKKVLTYCDADKRERELLIGALEGLIG